MPGKGFVDPQNSGRQPLYLRARTHFPPRPRGSDSDLGRGELASRAQTVSGTERCEFSAPYQVGGIRRASLQRRRPSEIVQASIPNEAGGSCVNVGHPPEGCGVLHCRRPVSVRLDMGWTRRSWSRRNT